MAWELKPTTIDIFADWTWDNFKTPAYKDRWEGLGHAGVFFINGKTGLTKYFEYGRYDPAGLGKVQKHSIPDALIRDGQVAHESLC